ncbi:MAG: beta-glucosidase [Planctomycetes bacterium]|nr:beta-glucosidase [Planctomycetota bacterium]
MSFCKDFIWGTSTAAYQIEGGWDQDGRGLSVWDALCRRKGAIWNGQSGDQACDHYNRYKEDIELMSQMGLQGYRLSISWPRIMPGGKGAVNQKGLDFYDALIDELLSKNITPYITLFHWDYPYDLYKTGGWLCQESPDWFADYAKIVVEKLSDRVQNWMTLNEPQCFVLLGHKDGCHAPGDKYHRGQIFQIVHNTLLAHGKAVHTIREFSKTKTHIGYAPVGTVHIPETETTEDIEAARRDMFSLETDGIWSNGVWMDPVFLGKYPEGYLEATGIHHPIIKDGDMEIISQPLDFFGVNTYSGSYSAAEKSEPASDIITRHSPTGTHPKSMGETAFGWPVTPECLYWGPKFFYERYGKPVIITENGLANTDWPSIDGKVHDPQRIDFLGRYLRQLKRAAGQGVDIRGYFQWSLLDNFEWAEGYSKRFGLVYVDYNTQQRIMKDSAYWYKEVIDTNGENL